MSDKMSSLTSWFMVISLPCFIGGIIVDNPLLVFIGVFGMLGFGILLVIDLYGFRKTPQQTFQKVEDKE